MRQARAKVRWDLYQPEPARLRTALATLGTFRRPIGGMRKNNKESV